MAAVFGAVAAAIALFTYGFVRTMLIVWQTFSSKELGFSESSSFQRAFKGWTGC
jgi:hypothetical protein